jgi:hypothetical protein
MSDEEVQPAKPGSPFDLHGKVAFVTGGKPPGVIPATWRVWRYS